MTFGLEECTYEKKTIAQIQKEELRDEFLRWLGELTHVAWKIKFVEKEQYCNDDRYTSYYISAVATLPAKHVN